MISTTSETPLELSKSREVCTPPPLESKQWRSGGSGTTYTVTVTAVIDPEPATLCPPLIMKLYQSCSKNKAPCVSVVFCFCYQRSHTAAEVDQQKLSRYRVERLKKVR